MSQFNLFEGMKRRDEGISRVAEANEDWMTNAIRIVRLYAPYDREFMAEEFQSYPGIGQPKKYRAWGALSRLLVQKRFMRGTGEFRKSSLVSNHGHPYPVYRRVRG